MGQPIIPFKQQQQQQQQIQQLQQQCNNPPVPRHAGTPPRSGRFATPPRSTNPAANLSPIRSCSETESGGSPSAKAPESVLHLQVRLFSFFFFFIQITVRAILGNPEQS